MLLKKKLIKKLFQISIVILLAPINVKAIQISGANFEQRNKFKTYGPVKENEKLWDIAKIVKPNSRITTNQVALAIFYANTDAFETNNINSLKKDVRLSIPDLRIIKQYTDEEAKKKITKDYKLWKIKLAKERWDRIYKAFQITEKGMTKESYMRRDGSIFIQARNKENQVVQTEEISYQDFIDYHVRTDKLDKRVPLFIKKERKVLFVLNNEKKEKEKILNKLNFANSKNNLQEKEIFSLSEELIKEKNITEKAKSDLLEKAKENKKLKKSIEYLKETIQQNEKIHEIIKKQAEVKEQSKFEDIWQKILSNPIYITIMFLTQLLIAAPFISWINKRNSIGVANKGYIEKNNDLKRKCGELEEKVKDLEEELESSPKPIPQTETKDIANNKNSTKYQYQQVDIVSAKLRYEDIRIPQTTANKAEDKLKTITTNDFKQYINKIINKKNSDAIAQKELSNKILKSSKQQSKQKELEIDKKIVIAKTQISLKNSKQAAKNLKEAIKEGNKKQKEKAKKILESIV